MAKERDMSFTSALKKLEQAVEILEDEDLDLEKFADVFYDGMKCATICQKKIQSAQQKIDVVIKEHDDAIKELAPVDKTDLFCEE